MNEREEFLTWCATQVPAVLPDKHNFYIWQAAKEFDRQRIAEPERHNADLRANKLANDAASHAQEVEERMRVAELIEHYQLICHANLPMSGGEAIHEFIAKIRAKDAATIEELKEENQRTKTDSIIVIETLKAQLAEAQNGVLLDVANERLRQHGKWDGVFDDTKYNALDWHEMISDYNGWARRMRCMGSMDKARTRYVQIAALAVAAVEALDAAILQNLNTSGTCWPGR